MDEEKQVSGIFTVADGRIEDEEPNLLKCFESELKDIKYMTFEELFLGFNSIKAITFSYDIGFINELMSNFDEGQIILGGNYLVQKDVKLNELLAEICTNAYQAGKAIKNHDRLVELLSNGDIEFRTPYFVIDHRKIYLLKADDGRTRVISVSANMSRKAWNNDQMEHYDYDDSLLCYEEYLKDFETAWSLSQEITMPVISSKKADDLVEGNAVLRGVKETGKTIVLKQPESDVSFDNVQYVIDHEKIKEDYKVVLEGINPKDKNGFFEIIPKMIEKVEYNQKKLLQKKVKINNITERYPSLKFDLYNGECYLNDSLMDLNPSQESVRSDIEELLHIYENFNQFVGNTDKLKRVHFKLMNAIFCSPFNAKLRCAAKIKGIPASSLPLFSLISSETSNSGKSFMVKAALKMMTGKELDGVKACDYPKDYVRTTQLGCEGVPFFIDEVDNSYISRIKDIIKNPEKCEDNQLDNMPMLLFASNDVLKPEEPIRKRMVFFTLDGALPSTIDKTAYESRGKAIVKKLGTGFYREYLKRMSEKVRNEMDFIIHSKNIPDEYYPDLMALSSDTIVSILEEYGYDVPDYFSKLTWEDDYSCDSNAIDVIHEIGDFIKKNKKACYITKTSVIIELGTDKSSQKTIESWKNILPSELKASSQSTRESCRISMDRAELENKLGYKLGGFSFFHK